MKAAADSLNPEGMILDLPGGGPLEKAIALLEARGLTSHKVEVITSWFGDGVARTRFVIAGHRSMLAAWNPCWDKESIGKVIKTTRKH